MNITALERPASLVERVCQQLAELIRGGSAEEERWLPGERSLAEKLGVSRTVVREATKRLEQQGMLEIQHGTGIKIVDRLHRPLNDSLTLLIPDMADRLQQLNDARLSIEPDAAAYAAQRATKEQLKTMRRIQKQLENAAKAPPPLRPTSQRITPSPMPAATSFTASFSIPSQISASPAACAPLAALASEPPSSNTKPSSSPSRTATPKPPAPPCAATSLLLVRIWIFPHSKPKQQNEI
jgi:DNA-binding transcriptional regulator YhcF (GntR family)